MKNFFKKIIKILNVTNCSCDHGTIVCPGCNGEKESVFGKCAGCKGSGIVICGKCGGLGNLNK